MPVLILQPHPALAPGPVRAIEVALQDNGELLLTYSIQADPDALIIPAPRAALRRDGLWKHSCCELFVALPGGGYREFNFSPSGEWAAWEFSGYREGMRELAMTAPCIALRSAADALELCVALGSDALAGTDGNELKLALACVFEAVDGTLSYWALAHPGERPDFHHPAGFACALARNGTGVEGR